MGGAVISLMDCKHRRSLVPYELIESYHQYGVNSVPVPNTETASSSPIYHNGKYSSEAELQEWRDKFANGPNQAQRFAQMCDSKKEKVAVNYRSVEKMVKEDVPVGKKGEVKTLDVTYLAPRAAMTYGELIQHTRNFSRGLAELGLAARSNVSIYEETRWEWLATIYGIWLQDMVASTVYANLGEDALFHALKETESKAIICNGKSVPNLLAGMAAGRFPACVIIYLDSLPAGCDLDSANSGSQKCKVIAWTEVAALGEKVASTRKAEPPTDNDSIALIMYTSGTTGDPKGVMHSHGSLSTGILVMDQWLWSCVSPDPEETYLSYLPLAHIMEFGVVSIFLARETLVCFGSPRTLTAMTARPEGDLMEYRPTLMVGVPRIFDTLKRAVEAKLPPPGSFKRKVFDNAYAKRLAALQEGKQTPFYNEKVFKQAREPLGGRMRFMLSGGGPLAETTQEFVNVVFCPMVIGWGLTETVCIGAIQRVGDISCGTAGQVLVGEELRLLDVENEYKHTDKPEPRGEICLRGPFLFKGYYKQPELTKEAIDEDGWFHTGDVASITKDGKIRLVGRVKALAKNMLGEYISMEALESIYAQSPLVLNNSVCVVVHPNRAYIVAIAITDKHKAVKFAKEEKLEIPFVDADSPPSDGSVTTVGSSKGVVDLPALLAQPRFRKRAAASMAALAQAHKRKRFECVRNVLLVTDEWTPENGLCTAAMKLKRKQLEELYKEQIDEMFAEE